MPNEANHHTDRQISLIRDPKANTEERGVGKSFSLEEKHRGLNRESAIKKDITIKNKNKNRNAAN